MSIKYLVLIACVFAVPVLCATPPSADAVVEEGTWNQEAFHNKATLKGVTSLVDVDATSCDACVNTKWNSWCQNKGRCYNGFGYYAATTCPTSAKDTRPFWGQGCTGLKVHGVWGNNHQRFFESPWSQIRDHIVNKTLGYDIRARYGYKYATSKILGCPDDQATNYNPYRADAKACTGLQALKMAQQQVKKAIARAHKAKIQRKKLRKKAKKAQKLVKKGAKKAKKAIKRVKKALKRKEAKARKREVKRAKKARKQEMALAKSESGCAFCSFSKSGVTSKGQCSVKCACSAGGLMTPYGKFSGKSYTGCPGEVPCDPVDSVAQMHDWCVTNRGAMACSCAHQIYLASEAAGKYLAAHPKEGLCDKAQTAAKELVFEAGMQWGACKVASRACKVLWLSKLGVSCGQDHDLPALLQRFRVLDSDGNGQITATEAYQALRLVHSTPEAKQEFGSFEDFTAWHKRYDKNGSGGLNLNEYRASWGL